MKTQCKHEVRQAGMNFARYRQCKNSALEGSDFCRIHQPKEVKLVDLAAQRSKTNLYLAQLIAKRKLKA